MSEIIRQVRFQPYLKGRGPVFSLTLWDTYRLDSMGKCILGYRLKMNKKTLFEGEDFACSPMHAIDSDQCVANLMGFLTLRPGDTDREYFENYTGEQLSYAAHHAEALMCEVYNRFGEG